MSNPADSAVRRHRPVQGDVITLSELLESEAETPAATANPAEPAVGKSESDPSSEAGRVPEIGGRKNGLDPTRYGDWEKDGRCIDF